jgi:acetyl-CoA carboxylase / biotin carboxylase 1
MNLGTKIRTLIDNYAASLTLPKQKEFLAVVAPIVELTDEFPADLHRHADKVLSSFFREYINVESLYQGSRDDCIAQARNKNKGTLKKVFEIDFAHVNIASRNKLIFALLDEISSRGITSYSYLLHELSDLNGPEQFPVSLRARRMLITHQLPSFEQLRVSMEKDLLAKQYDGLLSQAKSIFHILSAFFSHNSSVLRENALEVYLRRAYHAYDIKDLKVDAFTRHQLIF